MNAALTPPRPVERRQAIVLARAFFARFFDNDLTDGHTNVRASFIWLIAFLAMPGFFMAQPRGGWPVLAITAGPEGGDAFVVMASAGSKVITIGLAMAGIGAVAAFVWSSLLVDRRDVLVLGVFPLRHRTILAGKVAALGAFIGLLCAGMHALPAMYYGLELGSSDLAFFGRMILVHFFTLSAAGIFVFLVILAAQGVLLAAAGPRVFDRLTPALQMTLVAGVMGLLLLLPATASGAVATVHGIGPGRAAWVLWMPQVWFLGVYQMLLGSQAPLVQMLAARAGLALGGSLLLVLVTYPLAYRRVVLSAVTASPAPSRRGWLRVAAAALPRLLARDGVARATVQFAVATIGRTGLHRLVLAAAVGLAIAIGLPFAAGSFSPHPPGRPTPILYAPPVVLLFFLLTGLRLSFSLPAELRAAWLFAASAGSGWRGHRRGSRRLLWLLGAGPPLAGYLPLIWGLAGSTEALRHIVVLVAVSALFIEIVMTDEDGMPCSRPFVPSRLLMRPRWPWYMMVFLAIIVPALESVLVRTRFGWAILSALFLAGAWIVRVRAEALLPPAGVTAEAFDEAARFDLH